MRSYFLSYLCLKDEKLLGKAHRDTFEEEALSSDMTTIAEHRKPHYLRGDTFQDPPWMPGTAEGAEPWHMLFPPIHTDLIRQMRRRSHTFSLA